MGWVRNNLGIDITGGGASDAAGHAARLQQGQLNAANVLWDPYRKVGAEAVGQLMGNVYSPTQQDPNQILNNPFFKAMADQQNNELLQNRAALGLGSSGGTQDILMRNLLLLGRGFQQEDLNNQLAQDQQRFGQLFNTAQLGTNAVAQTGANLNQIGQVQGIPGMVSAQVKAQQGKDFMSLLGSGATMFGQNMMAGGMSPGSSFGGLAGIGSGSAVGGAGMGMLPGMGGAGAFAGGLTSGIQGALLSDKALKKDIEKVGEDEFGNIYNFRYTFDPDKRLYKGRMAQELREIRPDAVSVHESGYLQVSPEFMAQEVA